MARTKAKKQSRSSRTSRSSAVSTRAAERKQQQEEQQRQQREAADGAVQLGYVEDDSSPVIGRRREDDEEDAADAGAAAAVRHWDRVMEQVEREDDGAEHGMLQRGEDEEDEEDDDEVRVRSWLGSVPSVSRRALFSRGDGDDEGEAEAAAVASYRPPAASSSDAVFIDKSVRAVVSELQERQTARAESELQQLRAVLRHLRSRVEEEVRKTRAAIEREERSRRQQQRRRQEQLMQHLQQLERSVQSAVEMQRSREREMDRRLHGLQLCLRQLEQLAAREDAVLILQEYRRHLRQRVARLMRRWYSRLQLALLRHDDAEEEEEGEAEGERGEQGGGELVRL